MTEISQRLFGTADYESVLDVLSPSDALVREFWRQVSLLNSK